MDRLIRRPHPVHALLLPHHEVPHGLRRRIRRLHTQSGRPALRLPRDIRPLAQRTRLVPDRLPHTPRLALQPLPRRHAQQRRISRRDSHRHTRQRHRRQRIPRHRQRRLLDSRRLRTLLRKTRLRHELYALRPRPRRPRQPPHALSQQHSLHLAELRPRRHRLPPRR